MSLRVLLADESSAIKKVIELALQEQGVEVKPVNIGLDVVSVAKNFKPHIIFADVLLQKCSGYDVCFKVKNDPDLKEIPVILMWSSFMELDEKKLARSAPDEKLEKPFSAEQLQEIIGKFAPQNQNPVASFLSMPSSEKDEPVLPRDTTISHTEITNIKTPPAIPTPPPLVSLDINAKETSDGLDDDWQMTPLQEKIAPSKEGTELSEDFSQVNLQQAATDMDDLTSELSLNDFPKETTSNNLQVAPDIEQKVQLLISKEVQEQTQALIEETVMKIVPDIAEKLISQELNRLLKEVEKSF